ncbi:MAG TPA: alpha/beta fold hydrolase [Tepidisphaeraceae bacterium]|nr:alpha/beta fold hydrolase [Tepidisphaeraceae bacterium]
MRPSFLWLVLATVTCAAPATRGQVPTPTPATAPAAAATSTPPPAAAAPAPSDRRLTYVLVHGAWGGGWAFREVEKLLRAAGHDVRRVTLTGQGERVHLASPEVGLETHINDVVNTLLFDDLRYVVLMGHSYGGMVITGVIDRVPDRVRHAIYLDAMLPENGESANAIMQRPGRPRREAVNGFYVPEWIKRRETSPPPHDVPQSAKTFSDAIALKNQDAAGKVPTTYILTTDPGKPAEEDGFFPFYERAKARGWKAETMEADHNPQWSKPRELAERLEKATGRLEN